MIGQEYYHDLIVDSGVFALVRKFMNKWYNFVINAIDYSRSSKLWLLVTT